MALSTGPIEPDWGMIVMEEISRRSLLAAAAAGGVVTAATAARAASYGNPDMPAQGAPAIAGNPSSGTIPGPQNPALASQFPGAVNPPATDVGNLPLFWASFNNAPRRVENGGWAAR